jgi:hypothetical protein
MRLPSRELAIIPEPKITAYLLAESHRDGKHKAAFFQRFGYSLTAWTRLRDDLLEHAKNDLVAVETSPFGVRYVRYNSCTGWARAANSHSLVH